jgi:hypothetical protein
MRVADTEITRRHAARPPLLFHVLKASGVGRELEMEVAQAVETRPAAVSHAPSLASLLTRCRGIYFLQN